jgi:hypothetical protein
MAHGRRCSDLRGRGDGGDSADPAGDERQVGKPFRSTLASQQSLRSSEGHSGLVRLEALGVEELLASQTLDEEEGDEGEFRICERCCRRSGMTR